MNTKAKLIWVQAPSGSSGGNSRMYQNVRKPCDCHAVGCERRLTLIAVALLRPCFVIPYNALSCRISIGCALGLWDDQVTAKVCLGHQYLYHLRLNRSLHGPLVVPQKPYSEQHTFRGQSVAFDQAEPQPGSHSDLRSQSDVQLPAPQKIGPKPQ